MTDRKYGCLMVSYGIDDSDWNQIHNKIGFHRDVYNNDENEYGIEYRPHITLLYGLHDGEFKMEDLKSILPPIHEMTVLLTGISHFECPEYDVLKFDVDAPKYNEMNDRIRSAFPYTNDYPDYVPHMTISYLKPKTAARYNYNKLSIPVSPKEYRYGYADGHDEYFAI